MVFSNLIDKLTDIIINPAFAMAGQAGAEGGQKSSPFSMIIFFAVIFGIMYFLMIRPQQKQQKKHKEMVNAMKKGDKVVTRGGIHGKVHGIADGIITVEIAENVKIKISQEAIAMVEPSKEANN